jgi:hypothetical protein
MNNELKYVKQNLLIPGSFFPLRRAHWLTNIAQHSPPHIHGPVKTSYYVSILHYYWVADLYIFSFMSIPTLHFPAHNIILSSARVTIDGIWIDSWIYWTLIQLGLHLKNHSYTQPSGLGNGCQRRTLLFLRAHVLAGWRSSDANLLLSLQTADSLGLSKTPFYIASARTA